MDKCIERFWGLKLDLQDLCIISDKNFPHGPDTPEDAIVIGHTGVDFIHYCTIPQNGNYPIFLVVPAHAMSIQDESGKWILHRYNPVIPVAQSFEEFLSYVASMRSPFLFEELDYRTKEQFMKSVQSIELEENFEEIKKDIAVLKENFNIVEVEPALIYDTVMLYKANHA